MKRNILLMMIMVLSFLGGVSAQNERRNAVPENGFWEVITDDAHPRLATVRFYDLSVHLVYEEKLTGVKLDIRRRRTREALNATLKVAVAAAEEHRRLGWDIGLMAALIKKD